MSDKLITVNAAGIVAQPATQPKVQTSVEQPQVTTNVTTPTTSGVLDQPNVQVVVTGMGEESVPTSGLFKRIDSTQQIFNTLDSWAWKLDNLKLETAVTSIVQSADYIKPLISEQIAYDTVSFATNFNRVFEDNSSYFLTDYVLDTRDYVGDFRFKDILTLVYQKTLVTNVSRSDVIQLTAQPSKQSNFTYSDSYYTTVNYVREISEIVDATDDFLGLTNLDDDQTAQVQKTLVTWTSLVESIGIVLEKPATDNFVQTDAVYLSTSTSVNENKQVQDQQVLDVNKQPIETLFINEQTNLNFAAQKTEVSTVQEQAVAEFEKSAISPVSSTEQSSSDINSAKTEQQAAIEEITKTTIAGKTEQVNTLTRISLGVAQLNVETVANTETLAFNALAVLSDQVTSTDDFLGLANTDDDQTAQIETVQQDAYTALDFIAHTVGIVANETKTLLETKTANIQNYFQANFVAVGYLGTNLTL